jgi:hypothetical protein
MFLPAPGVSGVEQTILRAGEEDTETYDGVDTDEDFNYEEFVKRVGSSRRPAIKNLVDHGNRPCCSVYSDLFSTLH